MPVDSGSVSFGCESELLLLFPHLCRHMERSADVDFKADAATELNLLINYSTCRYSTKSCAVFQTFPEKKTLNVRLAEMR